jgi:hypothetical protein
MSRLVIFVEGQGDAEAAPILIGRLWAELPAELQVGFVDTNPFRTGGLNQLTGRHADKWVRFLQAAAQRPHTSAVLLVLDADTLEDRGGCVRDTARELAEAARAAGGGTHLSVAVVFFRQEYESLLIANYPHLPGRREGVVLPENVEDAPRAAKGWLNRHLDGGYKESEDQSSLTRALNFEHLRAQPIRCFRRLEHAIQELATAIATGTHIVSPVVPPAPTSDPAPPT